MTDLHGKNVVLTGGSYGIGPHLARALVAAGANVVLAARGADKLKAVASGLSGRGPRVVAVPTDVAVAADRESLIATARAAFSSIDVLVNLAGTCHWVGFGDQAPAQVAEMIETNVNAPMQLARLVLPEMKARGSGHIVNFGSVAGKKGLPFMAVYSATKVALLEWSNALHLELAGSGVAMTTICPTFVSGEGVFARHGVAPPLLVGSVTPERVVRATMKAIRNESLEVLISPVPVKPLFALNAVSVALGNLMLSALGVRKVTEKVAAAEARGE